MIKSLLNFLLLFSTTICLCSTDLALAQEQDVVINEIAWMGTKEQWQNEWFELYNPNDSPASLENWILKSKEDNPQIALSGAIGANSYFLLERTDDTTVPDVRADQIYKGGLNNAGEYLMLLNSSGEIIDEVDCTLGWFSGSNETKKTMERINSSSPGSHPDNWKNSRKSGGTPREENSPERRIIDKDIETTAASSGSGFSLVLTIGIVISLFFSMLISAFWLKIKQKKDSIKQVN